ncbi:MAG: UvrD-helicase domain-containing protein [Deltaproteobacteria bacterium]|nr:UvrD-helicase domain-containing protein [Deltaproteobacteria bacterium]
MSHNNKTPEQPLKFDRNYAVSAGAGSGKTRTLVGIYANLIEQGIGAKEIVVITFTEKAANEIKQRILEEISSRQSSLLSKAMRDISSAPIGTFHTICARILREHAVEARIVPDFKIMDEYESSILLQDAVRKTIVKSIDEQGSAVYWVKSMGFHSITESLLIIYQNLRNHGYEIEDAERLLKNEAFFEKEFSKNIQSLVDGVENGLFKGLANGEVTGAKAKKKFETFADEWRKINKNFNILKLDLKNTLMDFADNTLSNLPKKQGVSEYLKEQIDTVKDVLKDIKSICLSYYNIPHIRQFLNLLKLIDSNYSKTKNDISSLDFQDLLNSAKKLLMENKDVRRYYKGLYKKILVDEFQDTNEVQASIVYLLSEKDEDSDGLPSIKNLADSKLVVVGDMKQSIYGFRGADVTVFEDVIKNFGNEGIVYLNNNYRSCNDIISFVNKLFIKKESSDFIFNENAAQIHTRNKSDDFGDDARVEIILFKEDKGAEENRKIEAGALSKRIKHIIGKLDVWEKDFGKRKAGFGDIAILFRTLNDVDIYEDALKNSGIPYYLVKGGGFYHCQEVLDIYNMLQHIERGGSDIYLAGVLRSPFAGLMDETLYRLCRTDAGARKLSKGFYNEADFKDYPEDEVNKIKITREWFNKWKAVKDRLTIAELIETILADTGYLAAIISTFQGEQKAANIKKLIEMARKFEIEGNTAIRDFIYYLKSLFSDPPKEPEAQITTEGMDVVKLMTVHQAKGLEFPIVIIPDIGRGLPSNRDKIIFSRDFGIAAKYINADDNVDDETSIFKNAKESIKQRDIDEAKRIFYVACTRARDYLILSGEASKNGENWRNLLNGFFKDEIDRFIETDKISSLITHHSLLLSRGDLLADESVVSETMPAAVKDKKPPHDVIKDVFDFIPPRPSELVVSATALADFMASPEEFDMIKTIKETDSEKAKDIGSLVHRVMEKIEYKHGQSGLKKFIKDISKDWFVTDDEIKNISADIEKYTESSVFKEVSEAKEIYREFPFFMPVNEDGFTLYVKGIIDLLYCDKNGNWKIIDYKYSEYAKDENIKYKNQIKIYASAVSQGFECNVESAILFMKNEINILKQEIFDIDSFKVDMLEMGKKLPVN